MSGSRSSDHPTSVYGPHPPPGGSLCCWTRAQGVISTKVREDNWLVSGLQGRRYPRGGDYNWSWCAPPYGDV